MIAVKWVKPKQIEELMQGLRQSGETAELATVEWMQANGEAIIKTVVNRLRLRRQFADSSGKPQSIPEYTPKYIKRLARAGQDTTPDLWLSGGLLTHIGARIAREKQTSTVVFIGRPFGAANDPQAILGKAQSMPKVQGDKYWREAFVRKNKDGTTTTVSAGWVKITPQFRKILDRMKLIDARRPKKMYNAWLATYMSSWAGLGRWSVGGPPPFSFLRLTDEEVKSFERDAGAFMLTRLEKLLKIK